MTSNQRLAQQIAFINEIERLKIVYRRNRTIDQTRFENSAEHSWHGALMALLLAEHAVTAQLDRFTVVRMLLIHDLVEIYAGDTWLFDSEAALLQADNEARAAERLFALLPAEQGAELQRLWQEFQNRATPEAAFAATIDGLQPLLNHLLSGRPEEHAGVTAGEVLRRKAYMAASSPVLWQVAQDVIAASTERGLYLPEPGSEPAPAAPTAPIILVTGNMASGKSSVAQALAERLPKSVHLRGDLFRRMMINGQAEMSFELSEEARTQLQLRYDLAVETAKRYQQSGFAVVYQDIIIGETLPQMVSAFAGYPLRVVVLCPNADVVAARDQARHKTGYANRAMVDAFDHVLRAETPRLGLWLDTSELSIEQTVELILPYVR